MVLIMKLLSLILVFVFGLTAHLEAADQRRSSVGDARAVTPVVTAQVVRDPIVTGQVVHVPMANRASMQAAWEKDLYPYQLADVRRALAIVSDADFPGFATLVSAQLITEEQFKAFLRPENDRVRALDDNERNMLAGYNAEILVSFANIPKNRRVLLAFSVNKLCGGMDPDDKAESAKVLSGMISSATDEHLVLVEVMLEQVPAEMSGFEKKTLLKNLSQISADSFFAFCQIINKVLSVFYTPEHKKALYIRLSGIIDNKNTIDFREVANIPLEVFQAVDAHLKDSNRMIEFIVNLINKKPEEREAFIAANMG